MEVFIFSVFNGLLYGMLLFMLSSGLTLIFSMMGVLNFAHASFFMLGAYMGFTFTVIIPNTLNAWLGFELSAFHLFWLALIAAPVVVGVIGAGVERFGLRQVHSFGHVAELLFTFGLAILIAEVVQLIWGKVDVPYQVPAGLNGAAFTWMGLDYSLYRLLMLGIAIAMFAALFWIFARTRIGLIIQAALTHPSMVAALGHNVPKIFVWTFGFGTALAGLAGVMGGNVLGTNPAMDLQLGPIVFVVVVIGGLGSLWGALIASLFIGIMDNLATTYALELGGIAALIPEGLLGAGLESDLVNLTTASIAPVLPYLLLVVMLILRPRGLFGTRDV